MLEKKHPNKVYPAEDKTYANAEDNADNVSDGRFFDHGADSDYDLGDPVDAGDEQKYDLYKTGQFLKFLCHFLFASFFLIL